jgi:hypothetical protein
MNSKGRLHSSNFGNEKKVEEISGLVMMSLFDGFKYVFSKKTDFGDFSRSLEVVSNQVFQGSLIRR